MRKNPSAIITGILLISCSPDIYVNYKSLNPNKLALAIVFTATNVAVTKNIEKDAGDLNDLGGQIRTALIADCKSNTKFREISADDLQSTVGFKKTSHETRSGEKYETFLPDSGTEISLVSKKPDFILFIGDLKLAKNNKVYFYGGPGVKPSIDIRTGCINMDAAIALWDNMGKRLIKHDYVHVHDCDDDGKDLTVNSTEFIQEVFKDSPFEIKIMDSRDFK
ncbi:MAG: hypothetical protein WBM07_07380 [Chitinivibrionales bacterium]